MSTVRRSCDTLDVHPHPRLKESPLCHPQPYWRYLQQSRPRCAPSSGVPGMALCWRSISYCSVLRAETLRRLRHSCCAHTPACTGLCGRIAPGAWVSVWITTVSSPSLSTPLRWGFAIFSLPTVANAFCILYTLILLCKCGSCFAVWSLGLSARSGLHYFDSSS